MKKAHQSIRIFKNPWLEKLTHVHPISPLVMWAPIIGYLIWRSVEVDHLSQATIASYGALGLFIWTLSEYLLHRYVFHFPAQSAWTKRLVFMFHGLHHDDPVDPTRLVMPPAGSAILGTILFSLCRTLLGPVKVDPFFAFFAIGYLCYDYTHYAVHHFNPRTRFGKWMKKYHMLHHYATPDARWGVSSPIWDYVFGTANPVEARAKKEQPV